MKIHWKTTANEHELFAIVPFIIEQKTTRMKHI